MREARKAPKWAEVVVAWSLDELACARCGDSNVGNLEKAHVIDRAFGGLDVPWNILPLCYWCHKNQKRVFVPGDEYTALEWFGKLAWAVDHDSHRAHVAVVAYWIDGGYGAVEADYWWNEYERVKGDGDASYDWLLRFKARVQA